MAVLTGPNGAGKSTLLKIIAGLIRPTSGRLVVDGCTWERPKEIHRRVGLVSGDVRGFYGRSTALENLRLFGAVQGLSGPLLEKRVGDLAAHLEFEPCLDILYQELSLGMKARLALIRGLLHDPALLLLDEPFLSVEAPLMERLKAWLNEELAGRRKKTLLLVSHRNEEFSGWPARRFTLLEGRIQEKESREAVRNTGETRRETA